MGKSHLITLRQNIFRLIMCLYKRYIECPPISESTARQQKTNNTNSVLEATSEEPFINLATLVPIYNQNNDPATGTESENSPMAN